MTKLYPPEALSPKEWLMETCPCGPGGISGCAWCCGTGRRPRHQYDAASSLTAPTDEDLRVQQLEEQLATARERARAAEKQADRTFDVLTRAEARLRVAEVERDALKARVEALESALREVLPEEMGGTPDLFGPRRRAGGWDAWEQDARALLRGGA